MAPLLCGLGQAPRTPLTPKRVAVCCKPTTRCRCVWHKPGAFAGSTALAQARAAGVFTAVHERYWTAARREHGDAAGTWALIEVLLLHRRMSYHGVAAGITATLSTGVTTPELVAIEARRVRDADLAPVVAITEAPGRNSGRLVHTVITTEETVAGTLTSGVGADVVLGAPISAPFSWSMQAVNSTATERTGVRPHAYGVSGQACNSTMCTGAAAGRCCWSTAWVPAGNHWDPILDGLAAQREAVAVDLPGFGASPPLEGQVSIATLADAVASFITDHDLDGVDLVGSSMGARLVLELARRGVGGACVALNPGGFWNRRELLFFRVTLGTSIRLVRLAQPAMPWLTANRLTRTLLLLQLSARPWDVSPDVALNELRSFADSPSFDDVQHDLVHGPTQQGAPATGTPGPVVIGWGRKDRLTLPRQARTAMRRFPDAHLQWFDDAGHYPHWDRPEATVEVILAATAQ